MHADFSSEQHSADIKKADSFRARVPSPVATPPQQKREPIPEALSLESKTAFIKNDAGAVTCGRVSSEDFLSHVEKETAERSFYFTEKVRSNGKVNWQKRSVVSGKPGTGGVIDSYVSVPPWWGKVLCEAMRAGKLTPEDLGDTLQELSVECMSELCKRSGYVPVYTSVHPETASNIHFHMGYSTVEKASIGVLRNHLVGRSAQGKKGGLRIAGDNNVALARMAEHVPSKMTAHIVQKVNASDFDDRALCRFLDKRLEEKFPELKKAALEAAVEHATAWEVNHLALTRNYKKEAEEAMEKVKDLEKKASAANPVVK